MRSRVEIAPTECHLGIWDGIVGIFQGMFIQSDQSVAIFISTHSLMRFLRCSIADPLYNAVLMPTRELQLNGFSPIGTRIQILRTPLEQRPWCVYVEQPSKRIKRRRKIGKTTMTTMPKAGEYAQGSDCVDLLDQNVNTNQSPRALGRRVISLQASPESHAESSEL